MKKRFLAKLNMEMSLAPEVDQAGTRNENRSSIQMGESLLAGQQNKEPARRSRKRRQLEPGSPDDRAPAQKQDQQSMIEPRSNHDDKQTSNVVQCVEETDFLDMSQICEIMLERTPQEGSLAEVKRAASFEMTEPGGEKQHEPPIPDAVPPEVYTELIRCINLIYSEETCEEIRLDAVSRLAQMASESGATSRAIVEMKALPTLARLLSGSQPIREKSLIVLFYLAYHQAGEQCERFLKTGMMFPLLVILQNFRQKDSLILVKLVSHLIASLCRGSRLIRDFVQLDELLELLRKLVECHRNNRVLEHSCLAVAYLARGSPQRANLLLNSGIVMALAELMSYRCDRVCWSAILALRNLLENTQIAQEQQEYFLPPGLLHYFREVLKTRSELLHHNLLEMISWFALEQDKIQLLVEAQMVPELVKKLAKVPLVARFNKQTMRSFELALKICQLISNSRDESHVQTLINNNILAQLRKVIDFCVPDFEECAASACAIFANVSAGNRHQVQALLDANIFADLFKVFPQLTCLDAQKSIVTALELALNLGHIDQIDFLVHENKALEFLCSLLGSRHFQLQALKSLDDALKAAQTAFAPNALQRPESVAYADIIQNCSGLAKIEALLAHEEPEVAQIATYLVEENFIKTPVRLTD